jgi:parvulin-like peptidyl-prolyl isomerase
MKPFTLAVAAVILCCISAIAWAGEPAASGAGTEIGGQQVGVVGEVRPRPELQAMEGVRAWVVNGQEIPMARIEKLAAAYHGPYVLQDLVAETLLQQEAARKGIGLSEQDVQQTMGELREQLGVRSDVAFGSYLRSQNATPQWFHDKARAYALMKKVLADEVYVSDREIEAAYRRNQELYRRTETVAYRVMAFQDRAAAEAALAEVRKGKGFEEVAKATAPTSEERARAGEVQYYERGLPGLPPELATALFAAPLNQIAGPVEVMGTFCLIKVEKKIDPHQFTLDEVRTVIRDQLTQQRLEQEKWPEWIQQQLASANIQVMRAE